MVKKYFKANEFSDEVHSSIGETFEKGWSCGWECGDDYLSFKEGFTTYLYAHPGSGKTVFTIEVLIHLAKNQNKTICIYSPESGSKKDIVWNLIQVYTGKRLYGKSAHKITKDEIDDALFFVNNHFIILEHNPFEKDDNKQFKRFTVRDIFNQVTMAQKTYQCKIDVLCIDPFNLLDRELEDDRKAIQDYVLSTLSFINSASKEMKLHTILVAHLAGDDLVVDKDTGIEYMPKPHPSKLAGGQSFWRAGYQMVGLWREPFGVIAKNGVPYEDNCMSVYVQKTKPISVGKLGSFKLYYNPENHTLYEKYGDKQFRCGELSKNGVSFSYKMPVSQDKHWYEPSNIFDKDDNLF